MYFSFFRQMKLDSFVLSCCICVEQMTVITSFTKCCFKQSSVAVSGSLVNKRYRTADGRHSLDGNQSFNFKPCAPCVDTAHVEPLQDPPMSIISTITSAATVLDLETQLYITWTV